MSWEDVGEEMFINPPASQRAMRSYPYVLSDNLNITSVDRVVVKLVFPYVLASTWHRLTKKISRINRINTAYW